MIRGCVCVITYKTNGNIMSDINGLSDILGEYLWFYVLVENF